MGLAFQQALANLVFQRFNLSAQGGLRQENLFCCAADVAFLGYRHEITQLSEFHAGQHN
jgi:hypothetical protein